MEWPLRKVKKFLAIPLLVLLTIGPTGAPGCPTMPGALIVDPPSYNFMLFRILAATPPYQTDRATLVDVPVWVYANGDYRFKIGADTSTNCAVASGYTSWRPAATRLQVDISAVPDGMIELCLLSRRQVAAGQFIQQPMDKATIYKWIKDTTGPGVFTINDLGAATNDTTPTISWTESAGATGYNVILATNPDCSGEIRNERVATTSYTPASVLPEGAFHVCVTARDAAANTTNASNNGIQGVVDSIPPGTFSVTAPSGPVTGLNQMAQWTASSGADNYHLTLTSDAACSTMISEWNGITDTSAMITVPSAGSYYLCAEAMDLASNKTTATPAAFSVSAGPEEVVIEDRIGIPTSTNGRGSMGSDISGFSYGATVGKYHVAQTVRLTKIDGVGVPYGVGPEPIDQYGWKLAIHSNENSAIHTSLNGDVLIATSLPAPVIQTVGSNNLGWPSYLVSFDISATPGLDNIILNANTDYWITVLGVSGVNWDWMESISAGEPDTWTVDDVFVWAWNSQPDLPIGRAALKFRGVPVP